MATSDDIEAFLQVMANLHTLSTPKAAQNVTSELLDLRKRDQETRTVINRLTEENGRLIQQSRATEEARLVTDGEVKNLQEDLVQLKKDWAEINRVADERGRRLREKTAKVEQLEQHRVKLSRGSMDEVVTRWEELWIVVNQLATAFFSEDLDPEALLEANGFTISTSHQYSKAFPCPATNTTEAKQMRIIAASSIIAIALSRHVFRPVGMDSGLDRAVSELARTNPEMESFYRASHLAVLENLDEYRRPLTNMAIKRAVTEILSSVSQILPPARAQEFHVNLQDVCERAEREWQVFQRYEERYEVDMDGDKAYYDHAPLWKPSKENTPKSNGAVKTPSVGPVQNGQRAAEHAEVKASSAAIIVSVWPLLKMVGPAGADLQISGLALFSDQTRRVEEQFKRESRKASREENKRDDGKHSKRLSVSILRGSPKIA